MSLIEQQVDFLHACIHSYLYARRVYPQELFEQRRYVGITVWQCRHPDVNDYVCKVLDRAMSLFKQSLVERVVIMSETESHHPIDLLTIKFGLASDGANVEVFSRLEEEFRSILLKICMLDQQLKPLKPDDNWQVMIITKAAESQDDQDVLQEILTGGEFYVDNNKIPEQQALAQRAGLRNTEDALHTSSRKDSGVAKLIPLKSYKDETVDLSVSYLSVLFR